MLTYAQVSVEVLSMQPLIGNVVDPDPHGHFGIWILIRIRISVKSRIRIRIRINRFVLRN
jgi:hypothetical protein